MLRPCSCLLIFAFVHFFAFGSINDVATDSNLELSSKDVNHVSFWEGSSTKVNYPAKALEALGKSSIQGGKTPLNLSAKAKSVEKLEKASLLFIENKGQVVDSEGNLRPEILFTAKAEGIQVYFTANSIHYVFTKIELAEQKKTIDGMPDFGFRHGRDSIKSISTYRFTLSLEGANPAAELVKQDINPYYESYYLAHCPEGVVARSYQKFTLKNVYPGVNWVIYSNGKSIKYDFELAKANDVSRIKLKIKDAEAFLTKDGALEMTTSLGKVIEEKPISYQANQEIETNFKSFGNQTFGFDIIGANPEQPITIDPSIVWASFLGGSRYDTGMAGDPDSEGNFFITGSTASVNFPVSVGAFQSNFVRIDDAYLSKFSADGDLLWSTYYGGNDIDYSFSCATDQLGNVFITGETLSSNFPVASAFQAGFSGLGDAFLIKFNTMGTRIWATYFGGRRFDSGNDCATDQNGNVFIIGTTLSDNIRLRGISFQTNNNGGDDAFIAKFSTVGDLVWSSYFGGEKREIGFSCAIDNNRNLVVTGNTSSPNFPVLNPFQQFFENELDGFIAKFSNDGNLIWSTYYGGDDVDYSESVAIDLFDNIYLSGFTRSSNFPLTLTFQSTRSLFSDATLVKLAPNGSRLWATLIGGTFNDFETSCATDNWNNIYILITTGSRDLPRRSPLTEDIIGLIYLAKFNTIGGLEWATYIRTSDTDRVRSVSTDNFGNVFVVGFSFGNIAISSLINGFRRPYQDRVDAFVIKILGCSTPNRPNIFAIGSVSICPGDSVILGGPPNFNYIWSNGATTPRITVRTSGLYTLRTYSEVCTSLVSNVIEVIVLPAPPLPEISASGPTRFCEGGEVSLSGPAGNFRYRWSNGDTSRVIRVASAGLYSLQLTSLEGCVGPVGPPVAVVVDPKPRGEIFGPPVVCPSSEGVVYRFQSNDPEYNIDDINLTWLSVEGTILSFGRDSALIRWPEGRSTTAKVIVVPTSPLGCVGDTISLDIRINPRLGPLIPQGESIFCSNNRIGTFTAPFSIGSTYNWNIVGGTILSGQGSNRVAVNWNSVGPWSLSYQERLTTSDTICEGSSPVLNITINPSPREDLRVTGPTSFCGVATTQISLLGEGSSTYRWEVGELMIQGDSNRSSINLQAPRTGVYPIRVQETNSFGCSGPVYVDTLRFNPVPVAIAGQNISFCANGSGVLGAANNPELSYRWEPSLGLDNANISQPRISLNQAGEYVYRLIVQNSFGCLDTSEVRVNVFALPSKPTVSGNPSACEGDTVVLRVNNPQTGNTYRWLTNTGAISGNVIRANTSQQVILEARNTSGCSTLSDTLNIIIYPLPPRPAITLQTDSLLCEGEPFQLSGPPAAGYRWSNGANTQSQSLTGSQQISLRTLSVEGCLSPPSAPVNLRYLDVPLPSLAHNNSLLCPEKLSGTYSVRGGIGSTYQFSVVGGTITSSNDTSVTINFEQGNINRSLTVIETTERACLSGPITLPFQVDELLENPDSPCQLSDFPPIIPNIITPNADGFNDRFEVKNLRYYPNAELIIFNRFGKQLFQLQPYDNSFSAASLPAGTYYYLFHSGRGQTFKGWVEVGR